MTTKKLKELLKRHTKIQCEANMIERQITELLQKHCPNSLLLCEYGCLSVTEPSNYEKLVYKELKEFVDNE